EQERERRRCERHSTQRQQRTQAMEREQKPDSDRCRPGEVEREQRADHRHDIEVHGEVLLQVDDADDEHRQGAEYPQSGGRPRRCAAFLVERSFVRNGSRAGSLRDLAHLYPPPPPPPPPPEPSLGSTGLPSAPTTYHSAPNCS